MEMFLFEELKRLCTAAGFARKGKAFFRVIGDGVLQVIRCRYERSLRGDLLSVGLFSLYGDLQPQWFTASGCITRYSAENCAQQSNRPVTCALPMQTQLKLLENGVLPWLDTVDTQKKLIRAISRLDPRWNDGLKLGPYLACGEVNHAKKVLRELLAQHDFARINGNREDGNSDSLLTLQDMLHRDNPDELHGYLKENYERNMQYAKFCR